MATYILIPAYNAAITLPAVLTEVVSQGLPVIVVNDGSDDTTKDVAAGFPVSLLSHPANRGKGAALSTGFKWALAQDCTGVVTLDADGQHDPTAILKLVNAAVEGKYGILIASRFSQFEQMAGLRKIWNRFGVWCMRKRTGFEISDSQSGFRYYDAALLRTTTLKRNGYDLEMELLMHAWKKGFTIGSLPVPARVADGRSTSHFRPVQDTWNICMAFLRHM